MRIDRIDPCSLVNGDGCRIVVVFTGCSLNCEDCFSKELQDFNSGQEIAPEVLAEIIALELTTTKMLDGVTLSGGNPQEQEELTQFLIKLKELMPENDDIWMWTG